MRRFLTGLLAVGLLGATVALSSAQAQVVYPDFTYAPGYYAPYHPGGYYYAAPNWGTGGWGYTPGAGDGGWGYSPGWTFDRWVGAPVWRGLPGTAVGRTGILRRF